MPPRSKNRLTSLLFRLKKKNNVLNSSETFCAIASLTLHPCNKSFSGFSRLYKIVANGSSLTKKKTTSSPLGKGRRATLVIVPKSTSRSKRPPIFEKSRHPADVATYASTPAPRLLLGRGASRSLHTVLCACALRAGRRAAAGNTHTRTRLL